MSARPALVAGLLVLVGGCPQRRVTERPPLADPTMGTDGDVVASMLAELQDDVLTSYERDEPPDIDTALIPPEVGGARIGVGPGDVLVGDQLERAPSRWPLRVGADLATIARSKRLAMHLAQDLSAAWVVDELSWRIPMCGRTAVIPLRITMLFARDGDRWAPIFEHMSFGGVATPRADGSLYGATIPPVVASRDLADELSSVLNPLLAQGGRATQLATGPEALLLGPGDEAEWHGPDVVGARLVAGPMKAEDRRVGFVGRSHARATIAYWLGNVVAEVPARPGLPAGKVRLRTSFVFEKRRTVTSAAAAKDRGGRPEARSCANAAAADDTCRWVLVQGHVSQPIGDQDLAMRVFGTALMSPNLESGEPLAVTCDDGSPGDQVQPLTAPAAAPRPSAAARTP